MSSPLEQTSTPTSMRAIRRETERQEYNLELIASENVVSEAVLEAQGSILTNKYAEGYPGRRYYGGCEFVDVVEQLAIERAKALFGAEHANVQPHSGSQANMAVYFSQLEPGDTILAMNLAHGGHLTHGSPVNFSGKFFKVVPYGVRETDEPHRLRRRWRDLAREHRPKMIVVGHCAYPRAIDFAPFRAVADEVGAHGDGRHGALRGAGRRRAAPVAGAALRVRHHDDAQDAARPARRHDPVPRGAREERSTRRSSPATRAGRSCTSSPPRRSRFSEARDAGVPAPTSSRSCANAAGAGRRPDAARASACVSGGTDNHLMLLDLRGTELTGKVAAGDARPGAHHRQQEHGAVRPALAVRHQRRPHRHAGGHHARHARAGDGRRSPS